MDVSYDESILRLDSNAKEILNKSLDEYPEFIRTPLFTKTVLDPEEHYNLKISDPFLLQVYNLDRICTTMKSYFHAISIYEKYMKKVIEFYGGEAQVNRALKKGYNTIYIPPKPMISGNFKMLKNLIRAGAPETEIAYSVDLSMAHEDVIDEIENGVYSKGGEKDYELKENKNTKSLSRSLKMISQERRVESLTTSLYRNSGYSSFHSYSEESQFEESSNILKGLANTTVGRDGDLVTVKKNRSDESMIDALIESKMAEKLSDADLFDIDDSKYTYVQGVIRHGRDENQMDYYKDLHQGGVPIIAMLKHSMGKKWTSERASMIKSYAGPDPKPVNKDGDGVDTTFKALKRMRKSLKTDAKLNEITHTFSEAIGFSGYKSPLDVSIMRGTASDLSSFDNAYEMKSSLSEALNLEDDEED